MTDKEKLEKAIKFIEKIEKLDVPIYDINELIVTTECPECGCTDIEINKSTGTTEIIDVKDLYDIKDEAWHILADIKY